MSKLAKEVFVSLVIATAVGATIFLVERSDRNGKRIQCEFDLTLTHTAQDSVAYLRRHECPR